jgi:hypothetical protein
MVIKTPAARRIIQISALLMTQGTMDAALALALTGV